MARLKGRFGKNDGNGQQWTGAFTDSGSIVAFSAAKFGRGGGVIGGDVEYLPHWGFRSPRNRSMKPTHAASGVG
jgi:hypothetical protein